METFWKIVSLIITWKLFTFDIIKYNKIEIIIILIKADILCYLEYN